MAKAKPIFNSTGAYYAEAGRKAQAEAQQKAEAAKFTLAEREDELIRLRADLEDLEADLASGDVGPSDLVNARAGVEIAEARASGAQAALDAAERALASTVVSLDLADVVAPVVRDHLRGLVPVAVSHEAPSGAESLPAAFVVQAKPHTAHSNGYMSGEVEVHYLRGPLHAEFDHKRLSATLEVAGLVAEARHPSLPSDGVAIRARTDGDVVRDIVTVAMSRAAHPVPLIRSKPKPVELALAVMDAATEAGARIKSALPPSTTHVRRDDYEQALARHEAWGMPMPKAPLVISVDGDSVSVVGTETSDDGTRRHEVAVEVTVYGGGGATKIGSRILPLLVGRMVPTFGRVESAEVQKYEAPEARLYAPRRVVAHARLVFVSKAA